jgi:hypothetical protein
MHSVSTSGTRELVLVAFHVYVAPPKADAFGFEAKALFECGVSAYLNLSTRAQDTMPWQSDSRAQCGGSLTRASGQTCCASDCSVG